MSNQENALEKVMQFIKSMGPNSVSACLSYKSNERTQFAANWMVDNDDELVSLARSKKALIAVIKVTGGSLAIFGGLLTVQHITRLYQGVLEKVRPDESTLALPNK